MLIITPVDKLDSCETIKQISGKEKFVVYFGPVVPPYLLEFARLEYMRNGISHLTKFPADLDEIGLLLYQIDDVHCARRYGAENTRD